MNEEPKILSGRYEVGDLIGRGGMAEVHIGYDTRLGRTVAIKILRADLARDPSFQTRFRREAQAAAGLNHPAIVAVYDTGEDTGLGDAGAVQAVPFIVMEYVEGHTVRDILKGDVAAPIDEAVEITTGVLTALDYAHHAGLVHRDIKPANVMLTPTGAVKVMDFGIARALADAGQTMTQTQAVVGTAQYLSPEQARGENVDARSDLYSTGCLLFELLTGRPPFIGDSPVSVAYQHVREEAPPPSAFASDVPTSLDRVVARALKKNKDDRYSSAQEFLADLRVAMGGGPLDTATGAVPIAAAAAGAASAGSGPAAAGAIGGFDPGATAVMPQSGAGWASVGGGQLPPTAIAPTAAGHHDVHGEELVLDDSRRRRVIQIAILAAAVLGAVLLVWGLFAITNPGGNDPNAGLVEIPNVENQTEDAAVQQLKDLGFDVAVENEPSDDVERGRATRTDPEAGEMVDPETTPITLFVSVGPSEVEVPSVRGMTQADAVKTLEAAGLHVAEFAVDHSADIENGRATRTDPEEGATAAPGDDVTLYVSDGQVELPELRKLQETEARSILIDLGLVADVESVETDEFAPGEVITQDPLPGLVPQRSSVHLQVAKQKTTVQVPDVVGKSEANARSTLTAAGLTASTVQQTSVTVPAGQVISQNPSAGITVAKGTNVQLTVSSGPVPGS